MATAVGVPEDPTRHVVTVLDRLVIY
jgi:hypothetical protein